jgi:hypothetical protein
LAITQTSKNLLLTPIVQLHVNVRHYLLKRVQDWRHDLCPEYRQIPNVQFRFSGLRERANIAHCFVCSLEDRARFS